MKRRVRVMMPWSHVRLAKKSDGLVQTKNDTGEPVVRDPQGHVSLIHIPNADLACASL
jgi:hypothetical protein